MATFKEKNDFDRRRHLVSPPAGCRGLLRSCQVVPVLAHQHHAPLHHPRLQRPPVGALVPAHFPHSHPVDRPLFLPHGLDGTEPKRQIRPVFICTHKTLTSLNPPTQVTIISYTLGIPEVIMGITFLAAGTSVPDCMASLIVARQGESVAPTLRSLNCRLFPWLICRCPWQGWATWLCPTPLVATSLMCCWVWAFPGRSGLSS